MRPPQRGDGVDGDAVVLLSLSREGGSLCTPRRRRRGGSALGTARNYQRRVGSAVQWKPRAYEYACRRKTPGTGLQTPASSYGTEVRLMDSFNTCAVS